jgi:hypothetical protein
LGSRLSAWVPCTSRGIAKTRAFHFQTMIEAPGPDGTPIPVGSQIIRLAALQPKDYHETGRISPLVFKLSSTELSGKPARLSVFVDGLTTPAQAAAILGRPNYSLVIHFGVDQVRGLRPSPDTPLVPGLDVLWDHIDRIYPGAEGHAGIIGLDHPSRAVRKSFRTRLADIASVAALMQSEG